MITALTACTPTTVVVVIISCQFVLQPNDAQTYPEKIPIGALFDNTDDELRSAFSYEMLMQNKQQMKFKLSSETLRINTDDSYAVGSSICQLMASGVFAFFASHTAATISTIRSYSSTFHMPFVMTNTAVNVSTGSSLRAGEQQQQHLGYELYVRPHYARAIVDVIQHYGWKDIWYLYSSDEGLERLQQLLDALTDEGEVVIQHVYRVIDAEDAYQTLQRLDSRREDTTKHILIDLPHKQCEDLLNRQSRDTRGMQHHYFVVGLGMNDIDLHAFTFGGMNVTGFRMIDYSNTTVRNFLKGQRSGSGSGGGSEQTGPNGWEKLDPKLWPGAGKNEISTDAALAVDAMRVLVKGLQAVLQTEPTLFKQTIRGGRVYNNGTEGIDCDAEPVQPWIHGYKLMKAMREVEFAGLTGTVKFDKFGMRRDYKLEVLEISLNRGLALIGSWTSGRFLVQRPNLVRVTKGENVIANRTRFITSIVGAPYFMPKKKAPGHENDPDEYEGYCVDLARKVAEIVGFQYTMRPVKDKMYGKKEANGTWNGMVGELVRREADVAIAPLTITAERERVIDFSKPFMSLGISIMIKKPTKENPGVFSFMNPLSYEIWMCVIFAYIGVSVVLFLVSRFSPFEWHIEDHTDGPSVTNNFTIFNSLWFSLGAFMQQGCDIEPRSMSGRIVGSVWWFFTLIIISSYTANLAAFLTVERMQSPIESAEDLAKQTEIKYGTVDSGTTREFFKMSTIPVYERMWAFMTTTEPSVFVQSNEDGIARVRQGKYAFLIESVTNDYHNQRHPCDTMKVGSNLDSKGYGIGTPLGSDLRDRITLAVLELSEKEELARLEKEWWYEKGECGNDGTQKKQEVTSSLKLPNVAGIFYILMGGLVLALLMATFEFLYKSKVEARRKKTTFSNAIKSKARLSITGVPERQTTSYTYTPTAQIISLDGYTDTTNTHTQV